MYNIHHWLNYIHRVVPHTITPRLIFHHMKVRKKINLNANTCTSSAKKRDFSIW